MARQEDFLFAERALQRGWVTDPQVQECLSLLERLRGEMKIDETLPALLVKKGYLAPAQANVLDAEVDRNRADRPKNAIEGYRLLARIGAGAMGSVYEAEHLKLMVPVALKVLNPSLSSSRTQIERLKREAQLAARLNHPNVVRSLDVGESNGFHYLAMEFVEGETVRDRIAKGPMPEAEALGIVRQVAAGLAHAHAHGVVHRDVKPGNIMLTPDGTAKLGDFGLARGQGPSDLTLEHASIGTPQYVAPEQMRRGSDATARSDLFSLGATLYHMVTGRAPFDGETLGEIVQNVLACRFAPPESLAPELSRDAIFVIDRLMRASPRERYASADELVADLERIGRGEPIAPADFRGDYHAFLAKRRGKRNAILAACAIVLVAAGGFQILRAHSRAKREKLAQVCRAADATREDAGALGSAKELAAAIAGMDQARADAGAAGCGETAVAALGARLRAARFARTALDNAERIGKGSGDRKFRELDGSLSGYERQVADLDPAFPGALGRIAGIRGDLQAESDKAAKDRYDRRVLEGFRDLGTAMREAEAFAADLETRYLPLAAPWIGNVAQAPRMLKDLEVAWRAVEKTRERLDEEMRKERPSYRFAVGEVASLRKEENAALDPIATNPYLSGLMALADADKRAGPIGTAERTEWRRVLARANGLIEDGEADRAESVVREFRDRASSELQEVEAKLREVGAELKAVTEKQLALFDAEEQEYRTRLQNRLYMSAYERVAQAAASRRWVPEVEERFRNLRERAQRMTELTTRFTERVGKGSGKIQIGDEAFARDRIEPAAGDNKDIFVARGPKRTVEFGLGILKRDELEGILAFGPADAFRQGWFYAAEAYGADLLDPKGAKTLREAALKLLPQTDPWATSVSVALDATNARILKGEARAQQAEAELREAREKHDDVKALALVNELVESLKWTDYCRNRIEDFQKQRSELERLAGRGLFVREMGVPGGQVEFGGRDVQGLPAKPTSVTFRGRLWHPDEDKVPADEPDRAARLDQLSRAFWTEAFQGRADIADLVDRAMHQMLAWSGPVEVAPDGGYRPTVAALVDNPAQWWRDRSAAEEAPDAAAGERPVALELTFPFRADRAWSIEFEVEWPGDPGYFVVAAGQIQGVLAYQRAATRGGIEGASILVGENLDPAPHAKDLFAARRLTKGTFFPGVPCRMRLERVDEKIRFELWAVGHEKEKMTVEKIDRRGAQLEKDVALAQGRRVFRFYGAPGYKLGYVLRDVKITGILPERGEAKQ